MPVAPTTDAPPPPDALRATPLSLLAFVRHAPFSVAAFDRGLVCLAVSAHWTSAFGGGAGEGARLGEGIPDPPPRWRDALQRALGGEATTRDDDLWVKADGAKEWLRWAVTPAVDDRGVVVGVLIFTEDRTAWRSAEVALAESRSRHEAIVASAMDAILSVDASQRIVAFNGAAERMFRCTAAEAIGTPVARFIPAHLRAGHAESVRRFGDDGATRRAMRGLGPLIGLRADGEEFPVEATIARAEVAGAPLYTAILRDVTERCQLERDVVEVCAAEQRRIGIDLHDDLAQGVAGTMLLATTLARDLDDAASPHAARARTVADNLHDLLERVRAVARGLAPAVIDAAGVGGALRELAARVAAVAPVACTYEGPDALPGVENVVALHLYRLAQEALRNAYRHSGARALAIRLDVRGDRATLSIADDGQGMPASPDEHGMGLRTMRYRAGVIGGHLAVDAREGGGTVIRCTFPLTPST